MGGETKEDRIGSDRLAKKRENRDREKEELLDVMPVRVGDVSCSCCKTIRHRLPSIGMSWPDQSLSNACCCGDLGEVARLHPL